MKIKGISKIPFQYHWKDKMLMSVKVCTSRPYPMAQEETVFVAFGRMFIVTKVEKVYLRTVAYEYYIKEGCSSPEEFIKIWKGIHYIKGYQPGQEVWLHHFEILPEDEKIEWSN